MEKEIKEILDRLKDSITNPIIDVPVMGGVSEPIDNDQCLEPNKCKILLDYITNLQEENERLKNRNDFLEKVCVGFDDKYEYIKSINKKAIEYIKTKEVDFVDEHYQQQDMIILTVY